MTKHVTDFMDRISTTLKVRLLFLIKSLTGTLRIPVLTGDEVQLVAQVLV